MVVAGDPLTLVRASADAIRIYRPKQAGRATGSAVNVIAAATGLADLPQPTMRLLRRILAGLLAISTPHRPRSRPAWMSQTAVRRPMTSR
jgi:hypothetical protein